MTTKTSQVQPQTPEVEIKSKWVGVIYSPQLESIYPSTASALLGAPTPARQRCNPINIGLPVEAAGPVQPGMPASFVCRAIFLSPGTNMAISTRDWNLAQSTDSFERFVKPKVDANIIQVFVPEDDGEPAGYRCFSEEVALKLITNTLHESWIDDWLIAEERKRVKVAGAAQRAELVRIKEALQTS